MRERDEMNGSFETLLTHSVGSVHVTYYWWWYVTQDVSRSETLFTGLK